VPPQHRGVKSRLLWLARLLLIVAAVALFLALLAAAFHAH
jgi:hypothetical protein